MSRATRLRDEVAPSLFPFLAVLLCTMGALVLILMLIVSGAQASALSIAEESEKKAEEVESQIELASHGFQKQLTEGRLELEKKRLALQHLENHISEILAELEKLQRTAELAVADAQTDEATQMAQAEAISMLEKQLLEQGEKLKQKLDKPDGDKPIFAIIPYDGPNGTHRRPIYLECLDEGVRIQPEGVLIPIADLEPPYGPGNPLDAALRTIRAHYVPANHAVTSTAYPLLVVRPTGIRTYAMARAAMSGWDDQFGYELVGEDLELVFPDGEAGLTQKIAQALDLARQRQAALIMAMPQKYREFVGRDGPLTGGSGGAGAGGGPGSGGGDYASGLGGSGQADGGGWNGDGPSSTSSSRGGWDAAALSGAETAGDKTSQLANSQLAGVGNNVGFGGDPATNSGPAPTNAGQPLPSAVSDSTYASDSSNSSSSSLSDSLFGSSGAAEGQVLQDSSNGSNSPHGNSSASSSADSPSGMSANNASSTPGGANNSASAANMSGNQTAIPFKAPNQSDSAAGNPGGPSSSQSANSSSNPSSATDAPESFDSSTEPMDGQAMPQMSVNRTFNSQRQANESTTPVAARKGRGWAWSHGPPSQTTVVRSIRMQCLEDRWVILSDSGKVTDPSVTITYDDSPQVRAEKLAKVVSDRVNQWGIALSGGYWKPTLEVDVAPGAEWRFSQLQQLLSGSGLEVTRSGE